MNTHITIILDRSGSMSSIRKETEDGFNEFIGKQKTEGVDGVGVGLVQFDDHIEIVYEDRPLNDVPPLTLIPRGYTALLDAIGYTVRKLELKFAATKMPERVIILVMTDGGENASRVYTAASVAQLLKDMRDNYGWEFMFIGANQDAITTGTSMGFDMTRSVSFGATSTGTKTAFDTLSNTVSNYRNTGDAIIGSSLRAVNAVEVAKQTGLRKLFIQPWKVVQPAVKDADGKTATPSTKLKDAGVTLHVDAAEHHAYITQHWGRVNTHKSDPNSPKGDENKKPYLSTEGKPYEVLVDEATYNLVIEAAKKGEHGYRFDNLSASNFFKSN